MERRPDDVARPWVLEEGGPADALAGAATWVAHVRERCCVNRPLWSGLAAAAGPSLSSGQAEPAGHRGRDESGGERWSEP